VVAPRSTPGVRGVTQKEDSIPPKGTKLSLSFFAPRIGHPKILFDFFCPRPLNNNYPSGPLQLT
jgi:hypothetical protein